MVVAISIVGPAKYGVHLRSRCASQAKSCLLFAAVADCRLDRLLLPVIVCPPSVKQRCVGQMAFDRPFCRELWRNSHIRMKSTV